MTKDATLGGYLREHQRPPAFAGSDGGSYTVEVMVDGEEVEYGEVWRGYLFFLRWSEGEAVGHVESDYLWEGATEGEARAGLEGLTLHEVKGILDELVAGR